MLATSFEPFAQGLVEGQSITFEQRYADRKDDLLPGLAAELVHLQPDVILAIGTPAALAAKPSQAPGSSAHPGRVIVRSLLRLGVKAAMAP